MAGLCPCLSLQKSVIYLATFDCVCGCLVILTYVGCFLLEFTTSKSVHSLMPEKIITFPKLTKLALLSLLNIALAWCLRLSAKKKSYNGCMGWLIITVVWFTYDVMIYTVAITFSGFNDFENYSGAICILYKLCKIVVVHSFMGELYGRDIVPV